MRQLGLLLLSIGISFAASAYDADQLYTGDSLQPVSVSQALSQVTAGTIIIVSELHDHAPHHRHQLQVLQELQQAGAPGISVGMEFFQYTKQPILDSYLNGGLDDKEFLQQVGWGGNKWDNYRPQVLFPLQAGGTTWALNAPRDVTSKVARSGIGSLTPEESALLPPNWSLGNDLYYERFKAVMGGGHIPEKSMMRYFTAQSLWDETMAWRAVDFIRQNPDQILVILVGDFHAVYGGGLPDKIRQRGWQQVLTISQVSLKGATPSEQDEIMTPHPRYGNRADFVWVGDR